MLKVERHWHWRRPWDVSSASSYCRKRKLPKRRRLPWRWPALHRASTFHSKKRKKYIHMYIYILWLVKTPNRHWQQGQNSQNPPGSKRQSFLGNHLQKSQVPPVRQRLNWPKGHQCSMSPRLQGTASFQPMATSENNPLPPTPYGLPWANALWHMPSSLIGTQVWIGVSGGTPCQAEVQRCRFTLPKIQHLENIHRCTHCHQLFSAIGGGFWTMLDF